MLLASSGCAPGGAMGPGENVSTLPSKPLESGHAPVNGIHMYYEVHGRRDGVPLVLLHGGGSTLEVTFSRVLPVFAGSRGVIAAEEQGHGRTTDRDAPVTFESSADDVRSSLPCAPASRAMGSASWETRHHLGVSPSDITGVVPAIARARFTHLTSVACPSARWAPLKRTSMQRKRSPACLIIS